MVLYQAIILLTLIIHENATQRNSKNSNFGLDVLADKYGYPSEKHMLITPDGYILQMERIPYGARNETIVHRPPVLLVPGFLCGSVVFANLGPKRSLAFILADSGYDVWLLNNRGTTFSRKHINLNPDVDKKKYWNFSFQEMAEYDIPTAMNMILSTTNQPKLFYIGHSLGSTIFFAFASENPEFSKRFKVMLGLGPALQINRSKNRLLPLLSRFIRPLEVLVDKHQRYEFLANSPQLMQIVKLLCSNGSILLEVCVGAYYLMGYSPDQLDKSQLDVIFSTTPAGANMKTLSHGIQLYKTGKFAKYDYGSEENIIRYGQPTPPLYNTIKITTPIALFYGDRDSFISTEQAEADAKVLPSLYFKDILKEFNHGDYLWGKDAPVILYNRILHLLNI